MAGSQQYPTSTSAALPVAGCPANGVVGPQGWFSIQNLDATNAIWVGGSNVSATDGVKVAAGATLAGYLFSGDSLYVIAGAGTPTAAVLVTGV
jgi:hypothetical protein